VNEEAAKRQKVRPIERFMQSLPAGDAGGWQVTDLAVANRFRAGRSTSMAIVLKQTRAHG
jgi:hypothetical protein